ncbi:AI-2E family transporter [Enterococcus casseliflavus]|uniref:AI-2E family transporter n=1 Tax=Enterococcus casseliflavus TaxID=37734 RepID=UPI00115DCB89|nr:AI-2E family transporter [Enterococcus casseliflavus]MDB1686721.1 AI-2E family transporter [Enterococcus casseliflavus]MDB1695275.1 AI-2E family transporter [Enterococcus casseliflavus]MDB1698455.1 AI-2E family transporter [Enterococcus casseliflavus]MDB1700502.1 AI-2E family transporter [Enterococcus casseliflavus]MDB1705516.1 AI-2E family transporter [Enterococcus casseliflavus]
MKETQKKSHSWFWKWFLNNQAVTSLLVILLILLILLLFTKVSYLFEPVWQFLAIVGLPIILAGILYYLMNPTVDYLERKGIKRIYSIFGLFILVVGLIVWGVVVIIPKIQEQSMSFADNLPGYLTIIENKVNEILSDPIFSQVQEQIEASNEKLISSLTDIVQNLSRSTIQNLGSFFGAVATIVLAVITMPFILFYLLKDGRKLAPYFVKFLPTKMRQPSLVVLKEMNDQVSSYIRGQLTVAFAVAVMFMIGFSIIGLDYAITLGIAAGFLNLIPYLGSFLAMIPAVFLGIVGGPVLLIQVLIVFVIEQTIEGRLISPLVLGNELSIHPVTILLVLLTSGKLFGLVGVILGIPVYAAAKVVITHVFEWYTRVSSLYEEEEPIPEASPEDTPEV